MTKPVVFVKYCYLSMTKPVCNFVKYVLRMYIFYGKTFGNIYNIIIVKYDSAFWLRSK